MAWRNLAWRGVTSRDVRQCQETKFKFFKKQSVITCNSKQQHINFCDVRWQEVACHDMIWYAMLWHDMTWHDMIWYDMIWYDMIWHDTIRYDTMRYDTTIHTLSCERKVLTNDVCAISLTWRSISQDIILHLPSSNESSWNHQMSQVEIVTSFLLSSYYLPCIFPTIFHVYFLLSSMYLSCIFLLSFLLSSMYRRQPNVLCYLRPLSYLRSRVWTHLKRAGGPLRYASQHTIRFRHFRNVLFTDLETLKSIRTSWIRKWSYSHRIIMQACRHVDFRSLLCECMNVRPVFVLGSRMFYCSEPIRILFKWCETLQNTTTHK